jgi:hypothetical protein
MNKNTKIIIGVGIAALLFMFRKQLFGGGSETTEETFVPDTSGPSVLVDKPSDPGIVEPLIPPVKVKPSLVNVVPSDAAPRGGANLTPRVDSAVFFSAPNVALTR